MSRAIVPLRSDGPLCHLCRHGRWPSAAALILGATARRTSRRGEAGKPNRRRFTLVSGGGLASGSTALGDDVGHVVGVGCAGWTLGRLVLFFSISATSPPGRRLRRTRTKRGATRRRHPLPLVGENVNLVPVIQILGRLVGNNQLHQPASVFRLSAGPTIRGLNAAAGW